MDRVVEKILGSAGNVEMVYELGDLLRKEGLVKSFRDYSGGLCVYAVDSGFTVPPIEIAGGYVWIIQVAEVVMGNSCGGPPRIKAYVEHHPDRDLAGVEAKVYEREALLRALEAKRKGELGFDIAIVDGEVLTRYGEELEAEASGDALEIMRKATEYTVKALDIAHETGTPVVGVLKRSYSGDIKFSHGFFDLGLNDRTIASIILNHGEYLVLGTYVDLGKRITQQLREKFRDEAPHPRASARARWIEKILNSYRQHAHRVKVVFYKPMLSTVKLAVKTEIAETSDWSVEKVVSALSKITGNTGFPTPLDYVDALASVRQDLKRLVYELVYSKLYQRNKELATLLISLVNPQKPI